MTNSHDLRDLLAGIPAAEPRVTPATTEGIAASVAYLASDAAQASLEADTYWPKWDSPWWHMLLLFELGEAARIPERPVLAMVDGLARLPLKIFPIQPEDSPPGTDPWRDSQCHCALGSIVQVLTACGVDVATALPWALPWFARYQMADGGLNCDNSAYLVEGECPSSMVGTVPPLEAMMHRDRAFAERAAGFLVERRLTEGSPTRHNAEERAAAPAWLKPCFPRFYFYDVLRGLAALARWAHATGATLPRAAVEPVVTHLATAFPDGVVRIGRRAFDGWPTMARVGGAWSRGQPAGRYALLDAVSAIGDASPTLTRQWSAARRDLVELADAGRIIG